MGTTYHAVRSGRTCDECGRSDPDQRLLIGKSSYGWRFGLHRQKEQGLHGLKEWIEFFQYGENTGEWRIEDEAGSTIPALEMVSIITDRRDFAVPHTHVLKSHDSFVPMISYEMVN